MAAIIFICEKCHEDDRIVTGCRTASINHCGQIKSKCDVCGKYTVVGACYAYRRLTNKIASQKAVTAEIDDESNLYCS